MANSKNTEELKSCIDKTPYAEIFDGELFETEITKYMYSLSKRLLKLYPYNYAGLISYFRMKEIEIRNIFSVIEGIRYSLPPGDIMSFVVV